MTTLGTRETPYKGLVPYDEADAPFFFGRDSERKVITANLMGSRLTLFYGPSGVGKSSVLRAGVVSDLRELARREAEAGGRPKFFVAFLNSWRDDPLAALREQIRRGVEEALGHAPPFCVLPSTSLADELKLLAEHTRGKLLIVLDQFEEYFLYPQKEGEGSFAREFAEAVNRPDVRANFLVSLREDWLAKLDHFKVSIPNLFDNYLRVRWLNGAAARLAIEEPVALYNRLRREGEPEVTVAEGFSDKVIEQLQGLSRVEVSGDAEATADRPIQTPYLQLVMTQLWAEAVSGGHVLHPGMLKPRHDPHLTYDPNDPNEPKTRSEEIIRSHLDGVMSALGEDEQNIAARVFFHLVTPGGTKIALSVSDLSKYTRRPKERIEPVLRTLSEKEKGILTQLVPPPDRPNDETRYEISHDALAPAVLAWRKRYIDLRATAEARFFVEKRFKGRVKKLAWVFGILFTVFVTGFAARAYVKQKEAEKATKEAEEATAELAVAQGELEAKYNEVDAARRELQVANDKLVEATKKVDQQNIDLNKKNESLRTTRDELAAKVEELHRSQADLAAANKKREATIGDLKRIGDEKDAQFAELTRAQTELKSVNAELEKQIAMFKAQEKKLNEYIGQLSELHTRVNEARIDETKKLLSTIKEGDSQTPYYVATAHTSGSATGATVTDKSKYLAGVYKTDKGVAVGYWDKTDTVLPKFPVITGAAAAFSQDGRHVVMVTGDRATVFDCGPALGLDSGGGGKCKEKTLSGTVRNFGAAALDAKAGHVALAIAGIGLRVWDVETGEPVAELTGQGAGEIKGIAFSPNGKYIAAAGPDHLARVWEFETGTISPILDGHTKNVNSVAFNQSSDRLITASDDGTAIIWDLRTWKKEKILRQHNQLIVKRKKEKFPFYFELIKANRLPLYSAAFSYKGNFVVTGGADGVVRVWDVKSNTEVRRLSGHGGPVRSVSFSPDGFITSAGDDKTVRVWDPCAEVDPKLRPDLISIGVNSGRKRFNCCFCQADGKGKKDTCETKFLNKCEQK